MLNIVLRDDVIQFNSIPKRPEKSINLFQEPIATHVVYAQMIFLRSSSQSNWIIRLIVRLSLKTYKLFQEQFIVHQDIFYCLNRLGTFINKIHHFDNHLSPFFS